MKLVLIFSAVFCQIRISQVPPKQPVYAKIANFFGGKVNISTGIFDKLRQEGIDLRLGNRLRNEWVNTSVAALYLKAENPETYNAFLEDRSNKTTGCASFRFSARQSRVGFSWGKNSTFIDKSEILPEISHSARIIGMYEVNQTYPNRTAFGSHYFFPNMTWSKFEKVFKNDSNGYAYELSTAAINPGFNISLTFSMGIPSGSPDDTYSAKWSINITGSPVYKMGL